jgi:Kef-type K+ transport system membrane component KefB
VTICPLIIDPALAHTIAELGEFGVLLLIFIAGLEVYFDELTRNTRVAAPGCFRGVLVPAVLGWGPGRLFSMDNALSLFLGLALGATNVSISAQTLMG